MKILAKYVLVLVAFLTSLNSKSVYAEKHGRNFGISKNDETVYLGSTRIAMPLNRFILIRRHKDQCALKFTDAFTFGYGNYKDKPVEAYAAIEIYSKGSGTGEFTAKDVKYQEIELIRPERRGFWSSLFGPHENTMIECGSTSLSWAVGASVHFFIYPDDQDHPENIINYGVELAPTPWTNIQEIDFKDPRIKWYKFDEGRLEVKLPIEKIWPNTPQEPSH